MSENNPADSVPQNHPEEQTQQEGGEGSFFNSRLKHMKAAQQNLA
jgi:hypothetical protein